MTSSSILAPCRSRVSSARRSLGRSSAMRTSATGRPRQRPSESDAPSRLPVISDTPYREREEAAGSGSSRQPPARLSTWCVLTGRDGPRCGPVGRHSDDDAPLLGGGKCSPKPSDRVAGHRGRGARGYPSTRSTVTVSVTAAPTPIAAMAISALMRRHASRASRLAISACRSAFVTSVSTSIPRSVMLGGDADGGRDGVGLRRGQIGVRQAAGDRVGVNHRGLPVRLNLPSLASAIQYTVPAPGCR